MPELNRNVDQAIVTLRQVLNDDALDILPDHERLFTETLEALSHYLTS